MERYFVHWQAWVWSLGALAVATVLALIGHYILFAVARRISRRTVSVVDSSIVRHGERPAKLILPLLAVLLVLPLLPLPVNLVAPTRHVVGIALIGAIAWLVVALIDVLDDIISARHSLQVSDNLQARTIQTQVQVLRRIAVVVIVALTLSIMLMTFPDIRHLGESLFASAGVAALVAGLAARSTLTSLIAGVQIALTQPIRLDDVVIVEGEWGWIEEIGTTYVVVRIWDLRRLVVPLSYFIEKPFQNWTRQTADLLGTVFVYTDYTVPVDEVRAELHRILESSELWNGKTWGIQVTNASEHSMELRALMSASDSSKAWDLRCYVREKLIQFLQQKYPQSLPRTRAEILGQGNGKSGLEKSHSA
ncbi:MAG TPA: mechanosensitive ion channel family protein [Candidatus Aquilonibacter sp.]|nr:mechanosensitive ion channel family protein [Candidatus Aquilonibacter sp.]